MRRGRDNGELRKRRGGAGKILPGEGKAGEGKAGEGKAGEGKAGEGKAGEGKAGEGKAGEGKANALLPMEKGNEERNRARLDCQSLASD
uniref:Uncharacterized protein n=1 Tax=Meloidogyne javanica TaxID=6303 RepID=A0A915M0M6_MELJA